MDKDPQTDWGRLGGVGLEVGVAVGLGVAVGFWVDGRWQTGPWGVLIGALIGFVAGLYLLFRDVMRLNK